MNLTIENPWWNTLGLWDDPDLKKVKNSPLKYHPQVFSPDECSNPSVFTLRGPRRAGKTVSLKLLVADLIENHGWNPKKILWTTFDTFRTLQQAEDHLIALVKAHHPALLLIDEVTALIGWQRVIKKLRDNGTLSELCLILTGSSAYDLKAGAERMAGRRGTAKEPDRVLLPMPFSEFSKQIPGSLSIHDQATAYLQVGGFPFRVENYVHSILNKASWDPLSDLQIFDDVVFYEFNRRRLDRSIAIEVLGRLAAIECSSNSYEGFSKPLSIARDTARKYLDALGDAFLLATYSSYDTSRNRVAPKKDKKFGWIDPALGYVSQWLRQSDAPREPARAEWSAGAELLRRYEARLFEGLSAPRNVFTWKSSGGNEVDYLIVDKSKKILFPVEIKYQNSISDWDFMILERSFGKGLLVTPSYERKRSKSAAVAIENFFLTPGF